MEFLNNIWSYIAGIVSLITGLFIAKKFNDKNNEIIDLQNEINNIKTEKQKLEIENENKDIEKQQLKDEIKVKEFENKINEPKSYSGIKEKSENEIKSHKDNETYKINL